MPALYKNGRNYSGAGQVIQVPSLPSPVAALENTIYQYIGTTTSSLHNGYFYKCIEDPETVGTYIWVEWPVQDAAKVGVYNPAGSVYFANLPALSESVLGNVYDVKDAFVTTSSFVEGAGHSYNAGTNVAIVNIGTVADPVYKYDCLAGEYQVVQLTVLPTAAAATEGEIYQYIGTTTSTLTHGYFYECVEDVSDPGTYVWAPLQVQEGSNGALESSLTTTREVGGIASGEVFPQGTTFEHLFREMLNPTDYPTFTNPSVSIAATGNKLLEVGDTLATVITATFNRGAITPAYGTSGYRSGEAQDYSLNGGSAQASNTFNETVAENNKTFKVKTNYGEGEQPKDSVGNNYGSPLPAGYVESNTITWEFVNALWANTAAIGTIAKLALVSKSAKVKEFNFPAATVQSPEVFDVPASWTVTAVEVLNTLSNQWENCAAEFTVTDTTHDDAGGTATAYKRYTNNLGYAMDSRKIRVKWS